MALLAQITDTHLLGQPDGVMRGMKTEDSFREVLTAVQAQRPDYLILSGDLAHAGDPSAYRRLCAHVEATQIPSYWLPGNHDAPMLMRTIFAGEYLSPERSIAFGPWQLLLLDSAWAEATYGEGHLAPAQLDWLAQQLDTHAHQSVAIALHHHVTPTGIDWLDQIALTNRDEFWQIIERYSQVKTIFCGHVHLEFSVQRGAVQCFGTPSTCTQVKPPDQAPMAGVRQAWEQPGFRLFEFHGDGTFETTVQRVPWFK